MKNFISPLILWAIQTCIAVAQPIPGPVSLLSVKIGESTHSQSYISPAAHPLAAAPGIGTGAGSLAFIYTQHTQTCTGTPTGGNQLRFSYSTDGGDNWNVGSGISVSHNTPPPAGHCFGNQAIPSTAQSPVFSPNLTFYAPDTQASNLGLVLTAANAGISNLASGDAHGYISTSTALPYSSNFITQFTQPIFPQPQFDPTSLVARVEGEYWYVSRAKNAQGELGNGIYLTKGIYQPQGDSLIWEQVHTFTPVHSSHFVQTNLGLPTQPQIAFSPDGATGYVAFLGDLAGGPDSIYSLIWMKTTDGGNTWTQPVEFDMRQFPALHLYLQQITDSSGNPLGTGIATTAYDFDLVVDANNTPHFFAIVANGLDYSVQTELNMAIFDFTKDSFGDWNMIFIADQATFRWEWDNTLSPVFLDTRIQASRSLAGNIVSVYWTDTDTTGGNNSPINDRPDLLGRALNVQTQLSSPVINFSSQDSIWKGKILMPKVSPTSFLTGNTYTSPTVFLDAPNGGFSTCSYYYTGQVGFSIHSDFTEPISYFYNCQENPFSNGIIQTQPSCGMSDGALTIDIGGGIAPYTTQWLYNGGIVSDTLTGLPSGVYSVILTDSMACADTLQAILNDENGPQISIDSNSIMAVSCFGFQDGTATISVSGGTSPYVYIWGNGEQTATADSLRSGTDTVIVMDAQSCTSHALITIEEPLPLTISALVNDVYCAGLMNGSIEITAIGGNGGFQYNWNPPTLSDTSAISNLASGTYSLSIMDSKGCTLWDSFSIGSPDSLVLTTSSSVNTHTQAPYNGTASGIAFGGAGGNSYSWNYIGECLGYSFAGDSTFATGLLGGNYEFTVTDINGCTSIDTINVQGENCLTTSLQDALQRHPLFNLYPNPAHDAFSLQIIPFDRTPLQVGLFDLNGQAIEIRTLSGQMHYGELFNVSHLPKGIYLLQVISKVGIQSNPIRVY